MRATPASLVSAAIAGAVLGFGGRFGPMPTRPRTAAWYATLEKPAFTPPGPVFGLVWPLLDGLLWLCGARLLSGPVRGERALAVSLWAATMAGVAGFNAVLFGRKRLDAALGVNAAMLGASAGLATTAWRVDRTAGLAALPVAAWVGFALLLQEELWRRNPRGGRAQPGSADAAGACRGV